MNLKKASSFFSNLGHERRLEVIKLLVKAHPDGLTMGQIASRTKIPDSTLTHHIILLERSGLISREQQNQSIRCFINIKTIKSLADFLLSECCIESNKCC